MNYTQRHINVWISSEEDRSRWLLTCYYGHPETHKRAEAWDMLASLKPKGAQGWCVLGDFNEILTHDENVGGRPRQEKLMENFRRVLEKGNQTDLKWNGSKFTWSDRREDDTFTKERLDKALANSS